MRGKRCFIDYRKKRKGMFSSSMLYSSRPHKYYQPQNSGSYQFVTSNGVLLKESWKAPFFKIARRQLKKRSFLTVSSSMTYKSTSKPIGVRMGKGKGKIDSSVVITKKSQPIITLAEASLLSIEKLYKLLSGRTSSKAGLVLVNKYF